MPTQIKKTNSSVYLFIFLPLTLQNRASALAVAACVPLAILESFISIKITNFMLSFQINCQHDYLPLIEFYLAIDQKIIIKRIQMSVWIMCVLANKNSFSPRIPFHDDLKRMSLIRWNLFLSKRFSGLSVVISDASFYIRQFRRQ